LQRVSASREAEFVIRAFGVSEAGRVRKTNEDRFVLDSEMRLFAVADGMGGHRAGEVASELAIETLTAFIRQSLKDDDPTWPYGVDPQLSIDGNRLRTGICLANRRVFRASETSDDYAGMGTTIVGVLVNGSHVAIGSVGDSRIYLLSDGTLEQLTVDDSWAARILAQDTSLQADEIAQHPMRNVLTNVLGARDSVDVHVSERTLAGGDVLLLCSDGVHGVLSPAAIQKVLEATTDVAQAPRKLVDAALEGGTRDNLTALVIRYDAD
jgi:serine/threonine protein phosphatase PrpC